MALKPQVKVVIVNHSRGEKCGGQCGLDWSSAEIRSLAQSQLRLKYGDKVSLDYLDLDQPPAQEHLLQQAQSLSQSSVFPVLVINDLPRIRGDFDLRMLLDMVEVEMEVTGDQDL